MKFGVLKGKTLLLGKKVGLQFVKIAILTCKRAHILIEKIRGGKTGDKGVKSPSWG